MVLPRSIYLSWFYPGSILGCGLINNKNIDFIMYLLLHTLLYRVNHSYTYTHPITQHTHTHTGYIWKTTTSNLIKGRIAVELYRSIILRNKNCFYILALEGASRPSSKLIVNMFSLCTS